MWIRPTLRCRETRVATRYSSRSASLPENPTLQKILMKNPKSPRTLPYPCIQSQAQNLTDLWTKNLRNSSGKKLPKMRTWSGSDYIQFRRSRPLCRPVDTTWENRLKRIRLSRSKLPSRVLLWARKLVRWIWVRKGIRGRHQRPRKA